jgi:hypothetical protein
MDALLFLIGQNAAATFRARRRRCRAGELVPYGRSG